MSFWAHIYMNAIILTDSKCIAILNDMLLNTSLKPVYKQQKNSDFVKRKIHNFSKTRQENGNEIYIYIQRTSWCL